MMFISTQSPRNPVQPLHQKHHAGLASVELETLLTQGDRLNADVVDGETRQQILQSFVLRMRQVRYLRRLPVSRLSKKSRY